MAKCPKCGEKLHFYNVSQYCPACGVNVRFYNFEENFFKEAKLAELSQAAMHVKTRRMKAAFIGSKLTITRLIVMLLPLLSLLVPSGSFTISLPFKKTEIPFGILGLYGAFTGKEFSYISSMADSAFAGEVFTVLKNALLVYASVALFGVLVLLLTLLCFISYKNMQKIICVFAFLGMADCAAAMIFINRFADAAAGNPIAEGKSGFGLIVGILMFAVVFAINLILSIKGIPITYNEGTLDRVAIYKEVKAGRLAIDDLPLPVVETAATREIDALIARDKENAVNKPEKKSE